ncbi:helix-turn-helix transcriptional regulator [Enteroscipio rubneri]|uniref:XRE family transcriptional regulator n=1 Tax=Enteroscipio rubneri TaxID=2070686 RepID=A0A2K2U935_9ACTN|nr:helix-turn-helix transcriptional regulator [Enteroscipio rubneri]PNV66794.1 XRE family transcriptional regulator [Enteroscipio rubneri]
MSFRDNLQHLRAERNMTQEQLAMLLGVSRQSVTKWEAERSSPELDKLLKMCKIFDCSLDDLVQGDLTKRRDEDGNAQGKAVPAGPPQDVCGYDEHQRKMAWKMPTGIACIIVGVALGFFFEGAFSLPSHNGHDGTFILFTLAGVLAGLAFFIPAGMAHSAFVRAHPFVEDFYTEDDKTRARTAFARGLVGGIAAIFVGFGIFLMIGEAAEGYALFFLLLFVALGVWNIVHYGMLLGRTNVAEYNRSASDDLEIEDIMSAQVKEEVRDSLLRKRKRGKRLGAACGAIMIAATIVGLAPLFVPIFASPDISRFDARGTSVAWFWVAWPLGGMVCGIVALIWEAFGKDEG